MDNNIYYVLFSFNIPIKGNGKSVIYNLQKSKLIFVPDVMIDFIESLKSNPILTVKQNLTTDSLYLFDQYMEFLDQNSLGFYTTNRDEFPDLKLDWRVPNSLISCVIEFDCLSSDFLIDSILNQLEELNCFHIEFIIKNTNLEFLCRVSEYTFYNTIKSINFYIEYAEDIVDNLISFFEENKKIEYVLVFNCDSEVKHISSERILFIEENIIGNQFQFQNDQYVVNIKYFTESLHFHAYLNRKICIDEIGNVKNDLSFVTCFGNVKENSILNILESSDIKDLWNASPDKVLDYKYDILRYCTVYTDDLVKLDDGYYKVR
ncbi:hypothetical protein H4K35_02900 [Myroides sp. NP-2]|uniref:hypothetical protein n=1 Tax=Myroides sp. NP-2 TaxID=2759945 RepID=UPI0015FC56CE|nr:hypothetical protein [Myroides sp. NP-2]MBB1149086.1 hypothetical protein [Myroides sp. NP-2]